MMVIWRVNVELHSGGGQCRYYDQRPSVGQVVDLILTTKHISSDSDLRELASKYVEYVSVEGVQGVGIGLNKVSVIVITNWVFKGLYKDTPSFREDTTNE